MWGRCVVTTSLRTLPPSSNEGFFQVLFANTLHAYFTLIVVAYPSTSLSLGTLLLSYGTSFILHLFPSYPFVFLGTLTAAWTSNDAGFQVGGVVLLLTSVSIGAMFAIASQSVSNKLKEPEEILDTETQ